MFKARCRAGGAPSTEESDGLEPLRSHAHPPSKRRPRPGGFTLHVGSPARCERAGDGRGRRNRIPRCYPPPGFRPGPAAWLVHPPRAEGDRLERYGVTRASASNGARLLAGSPSILRAPGGSRTRTPRWAPVPETGVSTCFTTSAFTPARARVTDRIRTGPPSPGADPGDLPLQGDDGRRSRRPRCARRDSNPQHLPPQDSLSSSWSTSTQSRYAESNRAMRRTKAQPHHAHRQSWGTRARTWTLLGQNQTCCPITLFPIDLAETDLGQHNHECVP